MLESLQAFAGQAYQDHRSLAILAFYLTLCASLALKTCLNIYRRYKLRTIQPSWRGTHGPAFVLFLLLAAFSLATTWYYMFAFFRYSYQDWKAGHDLTRQASIDLEPWLVKLELWLRDRKLFREAWESVSETPAKFWWSGQIFLWTIGWSLFLGFMGRRYNISSVWVYMLLGQIVAISFAQNLFFATVLASGPASNRPRRPSWTPPAVLEFAPVVISFLSAAVIPFVANTPYFMPVLAVPHLLLFIPGLLSPRVLPQSWGAYILRPLCRYATVFKWLIAVAVAIQAQSTYIVMMDDPLLSGGSVVELGQKLLDTMFEHPAVSSVGWDVLCCSLSWSTWLFLHGGLEAMLG
ncbi:hypothetical protein N7466_006583 [Penicillium verhagenii]|uniref:uncharacterized protein n=1 Tax=Penicillium verhagenii TaxID=1562060 RepID=UPI0025459F5E|nr:uncharacterized protein N7466_006583 [Penicillium verhagenii]KAJ5931090.1 hypothetical protein N7466_006583 [Penicillium verhagenii]